MVTIIISKIILGVILITVSVILNLKEKKVYNENTDTEKEKNNVKYNLLYKKLNSLSRNNIKVVNNVKKEIPFDKIENIIKTIKNNLDVIDDKISFSFKKEGKIINQISVNKNSFLGEIIYNPMFKSEKKIFGIEEYILSFLRRFNFIKIPDDGLYITLNINDFIKKDYPTYKIRKSLPIYKNVVNSMIASCNGTIFINKTNFKRIYLIIDGVEYYF
jgi:hypothetical protein